MLVFDIDKNWSEVQKHLNDSVVQMALDVGMSVYAENLPYSPGEWASVKAPWMYSEDWDIRAIDRFEDSSVHKDWLAWSDAQEPTGLNEFEIEKWYDSDVANYIWDRYDKLVSTFYPQPNTPDWYRCYGANHFLAAFNCALGMRIAPHLDWKVVSGLEHTTAMGYEDRKSILCFDILLGHEHTAGEILKAVRPIMWRIPLGEEMMNMKHCLGKGAM